MTALKEYARLETSGLWRAAEEDQRREVGVSFGDATLVISDPSGRPLTHWSLAAVSRTNPRTKPAIFSPDLSGSETLEIDDEDMVNAIDQIQRTIARARPKPGFLRWLTLAATSATLAWLAIFWLPGALVDQAVTVVPEVKRAEIGASLLSRTARLAGTPCNDPFGNLALRRLQAAVAPEHTLHILPEALARTAALPGGHILIGRPIIEDHENPSVVAGYVVAEAARMRAHDPLRRLLEASGPYAAFRLLTTGTLPDETIDSYAKYLLTADPLPLPPGYLLAAFRQREVTARPYAFAEDVTGETTLALIEADPFDGVAPKAHLGDGDWISLQAICE
ncbi:MAG: hypothetical protein AAF647_04845 [Pseudomonadota bacterium]